MAITPTPASQPIIKNDLQDISTVFTGNADVFNLLDYFDDPSTTGQGARFQFYNPERLAGGIIDIILFDQADTGAPTTVANFLNYVNNNSYDDSFIHRVPDREDGSPFVVQGGVFTVTDNGSGNNSNVEEIPTNDPIDNEYNTQRENVVGTIAMALLQDEEDPNNPIIFPDSATSSWFFNVNDNSEILPDGFYTTFGQIINDSGLAVADTIESLRTGNVVYQDVQNVLIRDVPFFNPIPGLPNIEEYSIDEYIRLVDVQQIQLPELTFSASSSNPDLIDVSIDDGELAVNYLSNSTGTADITVQATNIFGETIEQSFAVDLEFSDPLSLLDDTLIRFQNTEVPGTYLFAGEGEAIGIRENFIPPFVEEGEAFKVSLEENDDLVQFNRFANTEVPGTYLFATEGESESIRANFGDVFEEEGIAFYAYGADADVGVDYYRLANTQVPGTYLFVNEQERNSALEQFPDVFRDEGVAFEVAPI